MTELAAPHRHPMAAVLIAVGDVAAALDWYERALPGARRLRFDDPPFDCLALDGVQIELVPADAKLPSGAAGSVVYWWVDDLNAALRRFVALGSPAYRGPMPIEAGLGMAQVRDPWGNCVGLRGPYRQP